MTPAEVVALTQLLTELTPMAISLANRLLSPEEAKIKFADLVDKIDFDAEYVEKVNEAGIKLDAELDKAGAS